MNKSMLLKLGLFVLIFSWFLPLCGNAQFKSGISDVSFAITDVKYGLPFKIIAPIHPGFEIGATFLKKDKEKSFHSFGAALGYYHHSLIADAIYLDCKYNYQIKIKKVVGIDLHSGLGFLYSIYPGDSYKFNGNTKEYERVNDTKANAVINAGVGLSFIRSSKIQPFLHYDFNVHNVWAYESFVNSTAVLKIGAKINIK